jgi:hypothetical protein
LRANILQPPCDLGTIQARLDAVSELLDASETFFGLQVRGWVESANDLFKD